MWTPWIYRGPNFSRWNIFCSKICSGGGSIFFEKYGPPEHIIMGRSKFCVTGLNQSKIVLAYPVHCENNCTHPYIKRYKFYWVCSNARIFTRSRSILHFEALYWYDLLNRNVSLSKKNHGASLICMMALWFNLLLVYRFSGLVAGLWFSC